MNVIQILNDKGRHVSAIAPHTTVAEVARLLSERRIGAMLVLDGSRLAGIVSERDIIRSIARKGAACLDDPVTSIMTSDVVTCRESDTVHEIMSVMTTSRIRHLPVMEATQVVGIVSIGDIVKNHIAEVEMEASALKSYVAGV